MTSCASPQTRRAIGSVSLINVPTSAKCPSSMSEFASLSGQSREDWNETLQKLSAHGPQGVLGFGEDFDADVAVAMRLADFVLEGPAAIGLKRTDPEAVPQRMYTSDYDSASGAEEHEEAAAATASPTTHST